MSLHWFSRSLCQFGDKKLVENLTILGKSTSLSNPLAPRIVNHQNVQRNILTYLNSIGHSSDEKSKRMKHTRENGMNTTQLEYIFQTIIV